MANRARDVVRDDGPRTFGGLVDAYQVEIYRYLWHLAGDPATADDLFQETFLRALPSFDRLRAESNHRAWIYRIATNAFLNHRRRQRRRLETDLAVEPPAATRSVEENHERREMWRRCRAIILTLPTRQRAAFVQRTIQGLSYADVARALGCTEAAARANVSLAVRRLRRHLEIEP